MARTTHRETSPGDSHLPSELAEQLGRRIAIAIEAGNWCQARAILQAAEEDAAAARPDPQTMAVAELPLDMRLIIGLESMGVIMVAELLDLRPSEIESHPGFGRKTVCQIRRAVRTAGVDCTGTTLRPG